MAMHLPAPLEDGICYLFSRCYHPARLLKASLDRFMLFSPGHAESRAAGRRRA